MTPQYTTEHIIPMINDFYNSNFIPINDSKPLPLLKKWEIINTDNDILLKYEVKYYKKKNNLISFISLKNLLQIKSKYSENIIICRLEFYSKPVVIFNFKTSELANNFTNEIIDHISTIKKKITSLP